MRIPGVDVDHFSAAMQPNGLLGYVDALPGGSISKVGEDLGCNNRGRCARHQGMNSILLMYNKQQQKHRPHLQQQQRMLLVHVGYVWWQMSAQQSAGCGVCGPLPPMYLLQANSRLPARLCPCPHKIQLHAWLDVAAAGPTNNTFHGTPCMIPLQLSTPALIVPLARCMSL